MTLLSTRYTYSRTSKTWSSHLGLERPAPQVASANLKENGHTKCYHLVQTKSLLGSQQERYHSHENQWTAFLKAYPRQKFCPSSFRDWQHCWSIEEACHTQGTLGLSNGTWCKTESNDHISSDCDGNCDMLLLEVYSRLHTPPLCNSHRAQGVMPVHSRLQDDKTAIASGPRVQTAYEVTSRV
jgi:hypothetical protein